MSQGIYVKQLSSVLFFGFFLLLFFALRELILRGVLQEVTLHLHE